MDKKQKFIDIVKDSLFTFDRYYPSQVQNYFIILFLAVIAKTFLLLMIAGENFVTTFEICVWLFMFTWLMLRILHSFNLLKGYYLLSAVPLLAFIIVENGFYLVNVSVAILIICKIIEIKKLFAKGEKHDE